jgi:hypothetical protein
MSLLRMVILLGWKVTNTERLRSDGDAICLKIEEMNTCNIETVINVRALS